MESMNYRKRLEEVYKTAYCGRECKHYEECQRGMENSREYGHRFYQAKYGKKYGQVKMRVLFVGKESTDNSGILAGRELEEPANVNNVSRRNTHYFGTLYTAAILLRGEVPILEGKEVTQDDVKKFAELRSEFCLTNYFKCAFKNSPDNHGVQVSAAMKKNCFRNLIKEIDALRPNIVIIQGKFSSKAFEKELAKFAGEGKEWFPRKNKVSVDKYQYDDSTPFYVVWSYHPSSIRWNQTREYFVEALKSVPRG